MNFLKSAFDNILKENSDWKVKELISYFKKSEKVLDFGCGDLSFSKSLKAFIPFLGITGVDIVDFKNQCKEIKFVKYNGKKLPFEDNSFDTVISFYVFHHCDNAMDSFKECLRVAKRVIIVESVFRNRMELPFMKIMDWMYNVVKPEPVPLSYQFYSLNEWLKFFKKNNLNLKSIKKIKQVFLPEIAPIGISEIFEVTKAS